MKSVTLITALTGLTTAMAVTAPIVVFGFLYFMQVQPERAAAEDARIRLVAATDELNHQRSTLRAVAAVSEPSTLQIFDSRTTETNRAGEFEDALAALLNGPAVGGVSNLSVDRGAPVDATADAMVRGFERVVVQLPVMVTFNARYEQIGRFFWNLRVLPTTFVLQSVELTPLTTSPGGLMRAKVSLLAIHRPGVVGVKQAPRTETVDVITPPGWARDPFAKAVSPHADLPVAAAAQPAPVVNSILFSGGRRVALVDGRIVGRGDRVGAGIVLSIEPDAVVIAEPGGRPRRVEIARAHVRLANR